MNSLSSLRLLVSLLASLAVSCADEIVPASQLGKSRFNSARLSTSPFNTFACSTCHEIRPPSEPAPMPIARKDPGYNLFNVAHRPSWWGGYQSRLLDAVNFCLVEFMGGRDLAENDESARQLYEYLFESSPERPSPALSLTVVRHVTDLKALRGDPGLGRAVYDSACKRCHGEPHTGTGRTTDRATLLPEATQAAFPDNARAVVIEKTRHGKFFNLAGVMPLYSVETMSDQDLAHLLAYLGL